MRSCRSSYVWPLLPKNQVHLLFYRAQVWFVNRSVVPPAIYLPAVFCCSEAFSSTYPDKEVQSMTTIHRLVTKFGTPEQFVWDKCLSTKITTEKTVHQMQRQDTSCKNSALPLVSSFCAWTGSCVLNGSSYIKTIWTSIVMVFMWSAYYLM